MTTRFITSLSIERIHFAFNHLLPGCVKGVNKISAVRIAFYSSLAPYPKSNGIIPSLIDHTLPANLPRWTEENE